MRESDRTGRVALVAGGFVLGLLLLEAALQVGAFVVHATGRELPAAWVSGRFRVLCIGDSNTYGLWLDRSDAQSGGRNVIQRRSLVYKLYYLIARSFDARELEIAMDSSPKEGIV